MTHTGKKVSAIKLTWVSKLIAKKVKKNTEKNYFARKRHYLFKIAIFVDVITSNLSAAHSNAASCFYELTVQKFQYLQRVC